MIFLTGGSGLLGLHILEDQRHRGGEVLALARGTPAAATLAARGARPLHGDVTDPAAWDRVEGVRGIVHAAAVIAGGGGWSDYEAVNVHAARLAARRARALGVPLVHLSSIAIYGDAAGDEGPGAVAEDYPFGSRTRGNYYARSKRLAEDAVREEMARGLQAVILRPCVVYGEGDRLFLPNVVRHARRGFFPLVGSGRLPLVLVHARNVAAAVALALDDPRALGGTFNVTSDGELTGETFVAGLAAGLGHPIRVVRIPTLLAEGGAAAADGIRRLLGRHFPGYRSAVRFLRGGNPYDARALTTRLGWRPVVAHATALPAAVRDAARRPGP
ncbi:MAG: NAD-dependent epimerase/dehydratase family protein [Gemmatimonadetes bacterium]|nr:NAD-dependent epimerase/dehydratase family protein [Gemmatimonadota bacterium]MBK7349812.1 NAD-dependent epimerase/dehydratase family protein [Gemmatimonadota bacterium]MBK7784442.1 NAD-dependent epimerase/dehydratase family protein [Gemmatimonadota bacterium]MBP9200423.1 NAD-dependent epimerase/dehydratase family protein [Gemmatimonadales bacterium]